MTTPGMWTGLRSIPTYSTVLELEQEAGMWTGVRAGPTYSVGVVVVATIFLTTPAGSYQLGTRAQSYRLSAPPQSFVLTVEGD